MFTERGQDGVASFECCQMRSAVDYGAALSEISRTILNLSEWDVVRRIFAAMTFHAARMLHS